MASLFDTEFDKEVNKLVLYSVQHNFGCFHCGTGKATISRTQKKLTPSPDFPKHQCSKCNVARYCNATCQKLDWKPRHKELCSTFCENRDATQKHSRIECLMGSGWLNEEDFTWAMRDRKNAFLQELAKSAMDAVSIQMAVVPQFQKLRLAMAVSFFDSHACKVISINHVVFEAVDEGVFAMAEIQSGGDVSRATLNRVYQLAEDFLVSCKEANCDVTGITLGRGLVNKCQQFHERFAGSGTRIIPSTDYM